MKKDLIKKQSTQTSCSRISNPLEKISPDDAWSNGTNVRSAMKADPKMAFSTLTALLMDAVAYLDMNKTLRDENDFIHAVRHLVDDFPAMKLEEWKVIMDRLKAGKYGKLYERLKLPELVEIFQSYEGERSELIERKVKNEKNEEFKKLEHIPLSDKQRDMWKAFVKKLELPASDLDKDGRWKFIEHPNTPIE